MQTLPSIETQSLDRQLSATSQTLESARQLLKSISKDAYNNRDAPPYQASVGGHIRHILDIFDSILRGIELKQVNLADRRRDQQVETDPAIALQNIDRIGRELQKLTTLPGTLQLEVVDELGNGTHEIPFSLAALLYQAQSHAIHHFACIGYILAQQNIQIPISSFGYNPTSPRNQK